VDIAALSRLSHGTTVATNALIQGRGGKLALVVTKGFRDLLEIGRQVRPKLYDFQTDFPPPLVPRERRFELAERVAPTGDVLLAPSDAAIDAVVRDVVASGAEACAVCFLFSFLNPAHERRLAEALRRAAPHLDISISSEVQPEFREYERLLTTSLNAYLLPVMSTYLATLAGSFAADAPDASIGVNQSSGGLMSVARARALPIRTALSGPAAGAMGAIHVARTARRPDAITLDMGGTSADVALIRGYEAGTVYERTLEGYPVRLPSLDINAVGAGGGSIAWFDRDGLLKVGPDSAGAVPGPACYGRGGARPTVSDANLVLGRLSGEGLLGGSMALDGGAARAVLEPVADRLGFGVERAAHGIVAIVVSNMVRAIRGISVERGLDPRRFALLAFGGAGPLHAADVARSLGIREIVVPPAPGILCAQGLIVSDLKETFVRTARVRLTGRAELDEVARHLEALAAQAGSWFASENIAEGDWRLEASLDMRYVGQNFELPVPVPAAGAGDAASIRRAFADIHELSYGYSSPDDPVEVVNVRLTALGRLRRPTEERAGGTGSVSTPRARRPVFFAADRPVPADVFERSSLRSGQVIEGPAIVEQLDATTVIFPGDVARVDDALNILIEVRS
jgi:N-methylhydantoinase A